MKIAVLGWGSLIWDQGNLQINDDRWHTAGPLLPIEFARISGGSRLTLVIKTWLAGSNCLIRNICIRQFR